MLHIVPGGGDLRLPTDSLKGVKSPPAARAERGSPEHRLARADLLYLFLLASIWGTSFLSIKVSLRGFSPVQNTVLRMWLGALALLAFSLIRRSRLPREPIVWVHLTALAAVANVVPYFMFALAEERIDSAIAGVLNATTPMWTAVIAFSIGSERVGGRKLAGLILGFAGAVVIFEPWNSGSQVATWSGVACLVAAACYGVGFVYAAHHLRGRGLTPLSLSAGQVSASALLSLLLIPFMGWPEPEFRADAVVAILALGILGTGIAYVINFRLIANRGASGAALVTYLIPVVAVIVGAVTLRERIELNVIVGAAVVLAGVGLIRSDSG
jgi:drug/metabolite transporter (DMT)-like permease